VCWSHGRWLCLVVCMQTSEELHKTMSVDPAINRVRRQSLSEALLAPANPLQRRGSLSNDSTRSQHVLLPSASVSHELAGELQQARQAAPVHIVVADDDPTTRKLINSWLTPRYKVTLCEDGLQALQAIRNSSVPVDLVLSDVSMPATDGMQLLAEIRADESLQGLPVIRIVHPFSKFNLIFHLFSDVWSF
jgi:PleD family two-component response regulator